MHDKSILFISPRTFGYECEIKFELERAGYTVDWYDERPGSSPFVKSLIRLSPGLLSRKSDAYFSGIFKKEVRRKSYDIVFVIKGEALSLGKLRELRMLQPKSLFIYYTWDSLRNVKNSQKKLQYFDEAYSFDMVDCECNKKIKHIPLFYTRSYEKLAQYDANLRTSFDIDLLILGSIHSDRYKIAQRILKASKNANQDIRMYTYFYFQSRWVFALRKIMDRQFWSVPWGDIKWSALDSDQVISLIRRSKILIDVNHPKQTGLTMRTIESIGAEKKLITTNSEVKKYDFYKPENILVVERDDPVINNDFLSESYKSLDAMMYKNYSLRAWIGKILGIHID